MNKKLKILQTELVYFFLFCRMLQELRLIHVAVVEELKLFMHREGFSSELETFFSQSDLWLPIYGTREAKPMDVGRRGTSLFNHTWTCASLGDIWHENSVNGMYFLKKYSGIRSQSLPEILGIPRFEKIHNIPIV